MPNAPRLGRPPKANPSALTPAARQVATLVSIDVRNGLNVDYAISSAVERYQSARAAEVLAWRERERPHAPINQEAARG